MFNINKDFIINNKILIKQWNFDRNANLNPSKITKGSNKKVWWICDQNHVYQEYIYKKAMGKKCPICENKRVLIGYNDLFTKKPNIAKEWNNDKNIGLSIYNYTTGSAKKVWWKCSKCSNEWEAEIRHRTERNSGCPNCKRKQSIENRLKTIINKKGHLYNPLLLKEWDYEKNYPITPQQVTPNSNKKVYWICSNCKQSYQASISNRNSLNRGCPICANKIIIPGINDLETTHPSISKEWDYKKNDPLTPHQVSYGSGKKVYWICPKNHSYQATILHRSSGTNCPICNFGRQTSFPEQAIFYYVKKYYHDAINKYKDIFDNGMELDIFIPSKKIGIEFDGMYYHANSFERDKRKYDICKNNNINLIRILEDHNRINEYEYKNKIADKLLSTKELDKKEHLNNLIIFLIQDLMTYDATNEKYCLNINIDKDEYIIRQYMTELKNNAAIVLNEKVLSEWHPTKNSNLLPEYFLPNSSQKIWWKCSVCDHEWITSINHRARGTNCPKCYKFKNKEKKHPESKEIYQYTLDGKFIK